MAAQDERPSFADAAGAIGTPPLERHSRSPHRVEGRGSEPRPNGRSSAQGQEPDLQSALTRLADAQADMQRTVNMLTRTMLERDNNLQQAMAALLQQAGGAAAASAAAQVAATAAAAGAAMQSAAGATSSAPTAPQAKPARIPRELDEALNKLLPEMESKLRGV
eukprot:903797-Pyramimonas_sp.AAC.1